MTEDTIPYRQIKKMNQSYLKILLRDPGLFKATIDGKTVSKSADYFTLGSAVDVLTTEGLEAYNEQFVVCTSMPSDSIKVVVDTVYERLVENNIPLGILDDHHALIEYVTTETGYQTNWKAPTRIAKVVTLGAKYFEFLKTAGKRAKINVQDNLTALKCYEAVTGDWFYKELLSRGTVQYKEVIQWEHKGIGMKSELDLIIKNEEDKTIIPVDLKTTSSPIYNFSSSFWKYRYDFQASAYVLALEQKYPGYTILPFRFVVVSTQFVTAPLIYELDPAVHEIGLNGGTLESGWKMEGLNQAIDRYLWHLTEDQWDFPKEYYTDYCLKITK